MKVNVKTNNGSCSLPENLGVAKSRVSKLIGVFFVPFLLTVPAFCQPGPPPLPPDPWLDSYSFVDTTNWTSDMGYAPIAFTNLASIPEWEGNALLLDTTNSIPAFLNYNIVEADGTTNLVFPAGAVICVFICDWASADTNQYGAGPGDAAGDPAYLLAAGDFSSNSPNGLWAIYFDAGGTNIYFGGMSNSTPAVFVSAPISWSSNSVHLICLSYLTNSALYLDGQLAATGGPVTIVPDTNVWTNGFLIGSDLSGFEQARGVFWYLELDNSNLLSEFNASYFTNMWPYISGGFAAWQASQQGSGPDYGGPRFPVSPGSEGTGVTNAVTGTNAYNVCMIDASYANVSGQGNTFTFTISGGLPGVCYDIFSTTNLVNPSTNCVWTWLGQGTNCGTYSITNQPSVQSYYVLGTPLLALDGSGLTVAYENLISPAFSSDNYGTPSAWYLRQGINPQTPGIGSVDSDMDGLPNYQEYLYGTNPQVSEGFTAWVGEPESTSGIP
jgi:hypothetical protein